MRHLKLEPITPLIGTNTDDNPVVKMEDSLENQVLNSENAHSSETSATPGHTLPLIGKRKERHEDEESEVKKEELEATISGNDDSPQAKKRRVDTSTTEETTEEPPVAAADLEFETPGEAVHAAEDGGTRAEEEIVQENRTTATPLPADGGSPVLTKRRRLSDDSEGDATEPQLSASPSGPSSETPPSASSSGETPDVGAPPAKRVRLGDHSNHQLPASAVVDEANANTSASQSASAPTPGCSILTLPLELQAEILILTGSPQHVLAVARTCKALCMTLLSSEAQFIWREARKGSGCTFEYTVVEHSLPLGHAGPIERTETKFIAKLPDPPKGFFGEAAYAAFVFDGGKCEFCGKETSLSYASFALRARICKDPRCSNSTKSIKFTRMFRQGIPAIDRVYELVPTNEGPFLAGRVFVGNATWPDLAMYFARAEQVIAVQAMCLPGIVDQEKFGQTKKRNEQWMKFCVEIHKWNKHRVQELNRTKENNLTLSKKLHHLMVGNMMILTIPEVDVQVMQEQIEAQLLALADKRERRSAEISLMKNRGEVETVYNRLRSTKAYPYMPSLPTFRKLPVIEMLQSAERGKTVVSVSETLQNDKVMKELLASQLKKWVDKAKVDLGLVLGFPQNWKNASKNILHPVERVTGRFFCKRCGCVEQKYRMDGCMDFAGACLHECVVGNKEKGRLRTGKKVIWDAANFVKDEKAINVLRASVAALEHAEDRQAGNYLLTVGLAVVCMSCEPCMVLDSRSLIGHSHRHDNMKVSFASEDILTCCGVFPYHHGLVQKLLGPLSYTAAGKKEIDKNNYGCRHCLRQKQSTEAAAAAAASSSPALGNGDSDSNQAAEQTSAQNPPLPLVPRGGNKPELIELSAIIHHMHDLGIEGPLEKPPPLFNFNGMRSHLKAKHQIEEIRDEDIFCFRGPEIPL
ncbi:hypothetical protein CPB84DRAFT_1964901 [Gymnopilus junonius]|uniref:F-box domain-containing protein n=1 Tax=Gymnopilus junonius TaxID=109634 RepID=A0A9P5NI69_GYMJU|nr:hypothetical protein CPB84DRAFT_1964901 [Gymnopilus junonius]